MKKYLFKRQLLRSTGMTCLLLLLPLFSHAFGVHREFFVPGTVCKLQPGHPGKVSYGFPHLGINNLPHNSFTNPNPPAVVIHCPFLPSHKVDKTIGTVLKNNSGNSFCGIFSSESDGDTEDAFFPSAEVWDKLDEAWENNPTYIRNIECVLYPGDSLIGFHHYEDMFN